MREIYPRIQAAGASLVAISPQLPVFTRELVKERRLPFEMLSDRGNAVGKSFGVVFSLQGSLRWVYEEAFKIDIPKYNGDDTWSLPMPARFIVDREGIVRSVHASLDHTVRPEPDSALEVLKKLGN